MIKLPQNQDPFPLCGIHNKVLSAIVFVIGVNVMVTMSLMNFAAKGERFTVADGRALEARITTIEQVCAK